ncbi:MAG: hypothetical protein ACLSE4_05795 [Clostridium sp.]
MGERYMMFEQYMQEYVQEHADEIRGRSKSRRLGAGHCAGHCVGSRRNRSQIEQAEFLFVISQSLRLDLQACAARIRSIRNNYLRNLEFSSKTNRFMRFASCVNFGKSLPHISMSRFA